MQDPGAGQRQLQAQERVTGDKERNAAPPRRRGGVPCEEGLGRALRSASWRSRNKGGEDPAVCTRRRAEKPGVHRASAAAADPEERGPSGGPPASAIPGSCTGCPPIKPNQGLTNFPILGRRGVMTLHSMLGRTKDRRAQPTGGADVDARARSTDQTTLGIWQDAGREATPNGRAAWGTPAGRAGGTAPWGLTWTGRGPPVLPACAAPI